MGVNEERVKEIIRENRYLTLATCHAAEAWVAPLAYVVDDRFNFYWYSEKTAKHSMHLYSNPAVAVAIFDSRAPSDEVDGLQIIGMVDEVPSMELDRVMTLYFTQSFPDPEVRRRWQRPRGNFEGAAAQRFYRFTPTTLFKCDLENISVDRRLEVKVFVN